MPDIAARLGVSFAIFVINLPFGFFRARVKKFTHPWGRCIYIPILINIAVRRLVLHWNWTVIPYLLGATILGHIVGGFWSKRHSKKDHPNEN